jgi:glycosyltransferase involved in cell wall biosynthesis
MRIAVVSPHLPTPALPMRGVTRFEQLHQFTQRGHQARGIVPRPWSPRSSTPSEETNGPVVVSHPRYLKWPGMPLRLERRSFARAAVRSLGTAPDVVLAHSATLPGALLGRVNAVFVVTIHDHELFDWTPNDAAIRDAIRQTLRGADCVVYVSEALRKSGETLAGRHRNVVIPIGVDVYDDISATWPARFTVCAVTRLIERKHVDRLIHAFARLAAERSDRPHLVIVGDGPERSSLTRLIDELGIGDLVELTGALTSRAAREHLARAHVMALPSERESLGAAYLEAMSLGIPVVATRGEGIAAHIEHGVSGILVTPNDDVALIDELRALAADPARARRIGARGRQRFLAGPFTWEQNAQSHLELFEELLKGRAMHTT